MSSLPDRTLERSALPPFPPGATARTRDEVSAIRESIGRDPSTNGAARPGVGARRAESRIRSLRLGRRRLRIRLRAEHARVAVVDLHAQAVERGRVDAPAFRGP